MGEQIEGQGGNFKKNKRNDKEGGDLKIKGNLWSWGRPSASNLKTKTSSTARLTLMSRGEDECKGRGKGGVSS